MLEVQRWRKRPTEVMAARWDGSVEQAYEIIAWLTGLGKHARWAEAADVPSRAGGIAFRSGPSLRVTTIDGNDVGIPAGAYVVIDSAGYPYPCDAEVFEKGHDRATVSP